MLFFTLLALLCVILLIIYNLHKRRLLKYVSHLPSPKSWPLIGIGYKFIGKNDKDIFKTILNITRMENSTVVWLGPQLFIILHEPEDVKTVLLSSDCLERPFLYRFLPAKGIFTDEVHEWKLSRKLMNQCFNLKTLMSYIPIFNEKSRRLVDQLKLEMDETNLNLSKCIFASIVDITSDAFIGFESDTLKGRNKEFLEGMKRLFELVSNRFKKFWLHPSFIYKLTQAYQTEKHLMGTVFRISNMVKEDKMKTFLSCNNNPSEDKCKVSPFLGTLFNYLNDGKVTYDEITHHMVTMLFGGSETTSLTISHTILMLAMHPKYQDKVLDELKSVCSLADENVTFDTISKLHYLEMVIKETMRLFPTATFIARNCLADTKINSCIIPKGTVIALVIHHMHRNPNVWGQDADEFNPDHFLPELVADRHPFIYIPFSGGARNCIGMKYGWIVMKVILAHLLLNFKFSTNIKMDQLRVRWQIALKLDNMHNVKVERRA